MAYLSKRTGEEIDALLDKVEKGGGGTADVTTYILPFTHEEVVEWAVASEKVGQIMDADQAIALDEAIKANKVVMISTVDGYYPCSAKVVGLMVYINYLDNDGNVVAISFDGQGTFDNAEVKPIGLPAGGREDQVLSKWSDANQYAWIDLPTYTHTIQSFTAEDVKNAFHSGDESASDLMVSLFDITEIEKAMQEGKVILIRANEQSNSVYVCDAINETGLVRITYRDTALHTVSFRFNPEEAEPYIWIDRHTSSLPSGGEAGQVLTKTGEGIDDVEWQTPQGGSGTVDIVDNLTTADSTKALSANMGRVLNEKFQYSNYLANTKLEQDGTMIAEEGWNVTTPIAVVGRTALTFECGGTNTSALCEYDANDNCIDYWNQSTHPRTITTRANTAYVRLAVPNSPMQDYFVAQNDVVLFNKLRKFDIVEQVVENTQKLENIGDSVEVKVENVTDANGKPLNEILSEISVGGAEGALVYNAPQTLTDEQKSQVAKNIGQPRERLIREWTNEKAEVLQPTDYDAETGYFTVESMPSYLAEDGAVKQLQMNYDRSLFLTPDNWKNLPKPQGGQASWFFVKREDSTHISLWRDEDAATSITIPSGVTVEKFYFTQGVRPFIYFPKYEEGLHRYRLVAEHTSHVPSRYNQMAMLGQEINASGLGSVYYELGTNYQSTEVVDGNFEIEIEIDHATYQNRFVSIKGYCTQRDNNSKLTQLVNRPLFGPWTDFSYQRRPNFIWAVWSWAIKKDTTIKLYEIIE